MAGDAEPTHEVVEFARALRAVKDSTQHSFETLAERLHTSRSALHRYCSGRSVPADFALVAEFAQVCRADARAVAELRRLWVLACEPQETGSASEEPANDAAAPIAATAAEAATEPEGPGRDAELEASAADGRDEEGPDTARSRRGRGLLVGAAGLAAVLAVGLGWLLWPGADEEEGHPSAGPGGALFEEPCQEAITYGQHDDCVLELQRQLERLGASIGTDGIFGPETQRRVEAFQVFSGLDADGVVGDGTKRALYEGEAELDTWEPEEVEERIREVFTEDPDIAVRIATCQSFLDPLHILPNTDSTHNWGVFQISDARLRDLRGTPGEALDPEWNIQAGYELWSENEDFSHWPHCLAAIAEDGETAPEEADGDGTGPDGADEEGDGDDGPDPEGADQDEAGPESGDAT